MGFWPFARAAEGRGSEVLPTPFPAVCGLAHLLKRPGATPLCFSVGRNRARLPSRRAAGLQGDIRGSSSRGAGWREEGDSDALDGPIPASPSSPISCPLLPISQPPSRTASNKRSQPCRVQSGNDKIGKSWKGPSRPSSPPSLPHPRAVQGSKLPPAEPVSLYPALWASLIRGTWVNEALG